jgi:hypothetical protein
MASTESNDHEITVTQAQALARAFRERNPRAERAGHFGRRAIEKLLAHPGCEGIRIYHGAHPDGRAALVMVGVDARNKDLVDGPVLDEHKPCPPNCDAGSPLNS